jgi:hypothetical protein
LKTLQRNNIFVIHDSLENRAMTGAEGARMVFQDHGSAQHALNKLTFILKLEPGRYSVMAAVRQPWE